jgi:hypothetical protein
MSSKAMAAYSIARLDNLRRTAAFPHHALLVFRLIPGTIPRLNPDLFSASRMMCLDGVLGWRPI